MLQTSELLFGNIPSVSCYSFNYIQEEFHYSDHVRGSVTKSEKLETVSACSHKMKIKNVNSAAQVVQIKTLSIHVTACFSSAVSDQQRASARVTPRIISDEDPGEPRGGGLAGL